MLGIIHDAIDVLSGARALIFDKLIKRMVSPFPEVRRIVIQVLGINRRQIILIVDESLFIEDSGSKDSECIEWFPVGLLLELNRRIDIRVLMGVVCIQSCHIVLLSHDMLKGKSSGCALMSIGSIYRTCLKCLAISSKVRGAHSFLHRWFWEQWPERA